MKVSGFTIVRNALKYNYPAVESIKSVLPICDEFVVNVGDSEDGTLNLIKSINSPKIRIIESAWDFSLRSEVLSQQTNLALKECRGDWAFYLQSDEVVHEEDLQSLDGSMRRYRDDESVDALRFSWFHFYGSYFRYRIDAGWYQKQDRIIRNNGTVESFGDAYAFRRKDGRPLTQKRTGAFIYHYGWVQPEELMTRRRVNAEQIGFVTLDDAERAKEYSYGDLNRFPAYFGTHPVVMTDRVARHSLSREDRQNISRRYWWHPAQWLTLRYKTGKRVKERID